MDFTTRLAMNKPNPDPVTGDVVDITKLNENFDKIDSVISATVCTSATRPIAPFQGQIIIETDTGEAHVRVGGAWLRIWTAPVDKWMEFITATAGDWALSAHVAGNTQKRIVIRGDGRIEWGDGTNVADTNLYRVSADLLKTDDSFEANAYRLVSGPAWVMTYSNEAALSALQYVPTTLTDVTGCSLTFTTRKTGAVVKAYYSFDFISEQSSAGNAVGRVHIAGTDYGDAQAIFNAGNTTAGTRATVSNSKRVVLGVAGTYTVKLRMSGSVAGSATTGYSAQASHTKLMVEVFE